MKLNNYLLWTIKFYVLILIILFYFSHLWEISSLTLHLYWLVIKALGLATFPRVLDKIIFLSQKLSHRVHMSSHRPVSILGRNTPLTSTPTTFHYIGGDQGRGLKSDVGLMFAKGLKQGNCIPYSMEENPYKLNAHIHDWVNDKLYFNNN